MTPLIACNEEIFVKMEMYNPGGSHKYRVAKLIIDKGIASGKIVPGHTTLIEKTGGNFGFGLMAVAMQSGISVDLAVGLSFSEKKRNLLRSLGAKLIGLDMLNSGQSPKEVVQYYLNNQKSMGKTYFFTDQFNNPYSLEAQYYGTGAEIVHQITSASTTRRVTFIGCAGTGASFSGVSKALRDAGLNVTAILVEPIGCDMKNGIFSSHRVEGISVGVMAPFIDWNFVHDIQTISYADMIDTQKWFYQHKGILVGNSSAAAMAVARKVHGGRVKAHNADPIVTIAYDSGLWYDDLSQLREEGDRLEHAVH